MLLLRSYSPINILTYKESLKAIIDALAEIQTYIYIYMYMYTYTYMYIFNTRLFVCLAVFNGFSLPPWSYLESSFNLPRT